MLTRVDTSELALQLHHYLDALNDEALRDFAVSFNVRLSETTRALFLYKLQAPEGADPIDVIRSAEKHRLTYALASVLCGDQSSIEAIPSLVRQTLTTYRSFVMTEEIVEPPKRRSLTAASLCALCVLAVLVALFAPYHAHFR